MSIAYWKTRPKTKYGAKKSELDGYSFASKGEANCYVMLKLLQTAGEIEILQTQDHVYLSDARIEYRADFKIYDKKLGQEVWVEFKGYETPEWRIKRRLWKHYGPGILRIYKGSGLRMVLVEEIKPREGNA